MPRKVTEQNSVTCYYMFFPKKDPKTHKRVIVNGHAKPNKIYKDHMGYHWNHKKVAIATLTKKRKSFDFTDLHEATCTNKVGG